jgi:hypothetical protein
MTKLLLHGEMQMNNSETEKPESIIKMGKPKMKWLEHGENS